MRIAFGDLDDPRILALLQTHLTQCRAETAAGSAHALDVAGLKAPDVEFYAGWEGDALVGVGALKQLGDGRGEVKSMHTVAAKRGTGAGVEMLAHLVRRARALGLKRVSLETGSMEAFAPARSLYTSAGFTPCGHFGDYDPSRNSTFMTLAV